MLIAVKQLRRALLACIDGAEKTGKQVEGLERELAAVPDSWDALDAFSKRLVSLPEREDWDYVEPDDFEGIKKEWGPAAHQSFTPAHDSKERVQAAFLARVCGCMLGKPVEINPTLAQLKTAGEKTDGWPLEFYVTSAFMDALGKSHDTRFTTQRENLRRAVADDDINYTICGMLLLERYGKGFTRDHQRDLWMKNLAPWLTWGPERVINAKSVLQSIDEMDDKKSTPDYTDWVFRLNPGFELCGALIRVDAYAYACPGRPAEAAELAWKDASYTHIRTGVYSAMYIAAAISIAASCDSLLEVMTRALDFVPQKSRFAEKTRDCLEIVAKAGDWMEAYEVMREKLGDYTHCTIYFEIGTLINSLHFSKDSGDAILKQVMQGNDTDSFGATAGSIAGYYWGKDGLDEKWTKPFNNEIFNSLCEFNENNLMNLSQRMAKLVEIQS